MDVSASSTRSSGYVLLTGYWNVSLHKIPQLNYFSERRILSRVYKYLLPASE